MSVSVFAHFRSVTSRVCCFLVGRDEAVSPTREGAAHIVSEGDAGRGRGKFTLLK